MTRKIRNGKESVNMNYEAKHEKKEVTYGMEPMPDEFYKARIKTLEKENLDLHKEIEALEDKVHKLQGVIGEMNDAIVALEDKEQKLKAAYLEVKLGV